MTEPEVLALLVALVTLIGGVLGVWLRIEGRIRAAETAATVKAEAGIMQAQLSAAQLAEYKLHVAETYVTKNGLREQTEQLMGAIGDVKSSIAGFNARMDRIIEDRLPKGRST
jgi:uncharacterized membrane protein YqgA involved in biofilm formation